MSARRARDPNAVPPPITSEWLFRAAGEYVSRYSTSVARLRAVLERRVMRRAARRGEDHKQFADLVDKTVGRFVELKLLDDRTYAEARVASLRRAGTSEWRMRRTLTTDGIEPDFIEAVIGEAEIDDLAAGHAYAKRRRLGPYRLRDRTERRDKDIAAMMRSGFSYSNARAVVDGDVLEREAI